MIDILGRVRNSCSVGITADFVEHVHDLKDNKLAPGLPVREKLLARCGRLRWLREGERYVQKRDVEKRIWMPATGDNEWLRAHQRGSRRDRQDGDRARRRGRDRDRSGRRRGRSSSSESDTKSSKAGKKVWHADANGAATTTKRSTMRQQADRSRTPLSSKSASPQGTGSKQIRTGSPNKF